MFEQAAREAERERQRIRWATREEPEAKIIGDK